MDCALQINFLCLSSSPGTGKDKFRSKGHMSHARVREDNPAEDMETEKRDQSLLAECKSYLSSIFVRWEPVFQPSETQAELPKDKLDPSELDSDTAHLLTKWSLRWLLEDSCDESRAKEFLRWFEQAVVKHRKIADLVTLDPDLRADLLRLYHHTAEAQRHLSVKTRAETLQLFSNMMIRLLEMQGRLTERHQAVVSACSPEPSRDASRNGETPTTYSRFLCLQMGILHSVKRTFQSLNNPRSIVRW